MSVSKILFPPLPTTTDTSRTLRSYFANTKNAKPVHAVIDRSGELRSWALSKSRAHSWGHAHLWDEFRVVEIGRDLGQFVAKAA